MPATIFTSRLGALIISDSNDHLLATVPSTETWVVRDIVLYNGDAAAQSPQVFIGVPGTGNLFLARSSIQPLTVFHLDLRQAMNAGDSLHCIGAGAQIRVVITGYRFQNP